MRCFRCQGNMARIKFYGPGDPFWGWKCFSCGDILDPVILENRLESLQVPSIERKEVPKEARERKESDGRPARRED